MAKYMEIIFALLVAGSSATYARSSPSVDDSASMKAMRMYTDEEIAAAIKFMTMAPTATDPDRITELMLELCGVMNKPQPDMGHKSPDELAEISKALDEHLSKYKTQFWGSEVQSSRITQANLSSLKQMCAGIKKHLFPTTAASGTESA